MPQSVRVAVISAAFCIRINCRHLMVAEVGGTKDHIGCTKRACDNHQCGARLKPADKEPPFELPPDVPLAPE